MRILWFSNKVFSVKDTGGTGTWLDVMANSLVATGQVELCNIAMGSVKAPTRQDAGPIHQWIVPAAAVGRGGLPPSRIVAGIIKVVNDVAPDLVHVWGAEEYWGLLTARGLIQSRALLEIQGLKEPYSRVFAGGLTEREQRACIGIKEIIKRRSIASGRRAFEKWSRFEREIIAGYGFITTQTDWVKAWVRFSNGSARIFHTELILREAFYNAKPWYLQNAPVIFCSAAYPVPYKGIHDAVRALALLKRNFPIVRLRIAGALKSRGIRQEGYITWVNRLADALHVAEQIDWLGPLSSTEIVAELQNCSVMLIPTYIENCCTAMQEAMMVGTPIVASCVGGLLSVARDEDSALFFSPGDEVMCAYQVERLLTDQGLAERLSDKARAVALIRNDPKMIIANQLEIYRQVIATGRVVDGRLF